MPQIPSLQVLASAHLPAAAPGASRRATCGLLRRGYGPRRATHRTHPQLPDHEQGFQPCRGHDLALLGGTPGYHDANPLVGAVIPDAHGRLLRVGYHSGAGTAR